MIYGKHGYISSDTIEYTCRYMGASTTSLCPTDDCRKISLYEKVVSSFMAVELK